MVSAVTSEARVAFAPLQQATSQDVAAVGALAQASTDNVVENCLFAGLAYTGLGVTVNATNNGVNVASGWLVAGGPAYALRDTFALDLSSVIAAVPDSTKTAVVLVLADGEESLTGESRTFLDASKKPTKPADPWPTVTLATNTRAVRTAVISKVAGSADVQPATPPYNAALCLLATVIVSNTGVVSVTQSTAAQIIRQEQIAATVGMLSDYQATLQGIIDGLLSSVSALALSQKDLRSQLQAAIADLQAQINALATRTTSAPASIFKGADYFTDLSQSAPTATSYNAVVSGGLRFATSAHADVPLAPQNPYASNLIVTSDNHLIPKYQELGANRAGGSGDYGNNTRAVITSFGGVTAQLLRRGFGRARVRSGTSLKAVQANQVLASGDPSQIFAIDPTTLVYDPTWGDWRSGSPEFTRRNGYWLDISSRGFWTPVVGIGSTGGLPAIDQVVRPSSSGMVSSVAVSIRNLYYGQQGTLRMLVVGDSNGSPDWSHVYADGIVSTSDHGIPDEGVTTGVSGQMVFAMPYPILLKGGQTYHFVFLSASQAIEIVQLASNPFGGSVLSYVNGGWSPVSGLTALGMEIRYASFANATITIDLAPLQLAGGADTIDILASLLLPEGCTIGYQVYVGGAWVSLEQITDSTNPLAGNPSNLPLRLVLSGNSRLAPVLDLAPSLGRISKSSAALDHVSSPQVPSAPVTTIHKSLVVDGWNPAVQTLTADLRTGTGYGTVTAPTATVDAIQPDGSLLRQWTWVLGAAVPSFEMEVIGATTDVTKTFVGRQTAWDASP